MPLKPGGRDAPMMMTNTMRTLCCAVLFAGCFSGSDGGDGAGTGGAAGSVSGGNGGTGAGTSGVTGGTNAIGGTGGSTAGAGGSGGEGGTGTGGTSSGGTTGGSAGSGGTGGAGSCSPDVPAGAAPVACGSDTCAPDEICVRPCCGGPPPACEALPQGGTCTPPDVPSTCDDGTPGCLDICTPPPPSCVPAAEVMCRDCNGSPRNCEAPSASGCFGEIDQDMRNVSCTCA